MPPGPSPRHPPGSTTLLQGSTAPTVCSAWQGGALLAQHRGGTSTQAQAWVLRPGATRRGPESVSPSQGTWATVQGPSVSWALWASCLLILRSLVLGPAPRSPVQSTVLNHRKPAAGRGYAMTPSLVPGISYRPSASLPGRISRGACTETWGV